MGICMTNCQVFGILETIHWCYNLIYFNNLSKTPFCNVTVCLWKFRPALKFCEESQRMFYEECSVPFSNKSQWLTIPLLCLYSILLLLLFPRALKCQEVEIYPSQVPSSVSWEFTSDWGKQKKPSKFTTEHMSTAEVCILSNTMAHTRGHSINTNWIGFYYAVRPHPILLLPPSSEKPAQSVWK